MKMFESYCGIGLRRERGGNNIVVRSIDGDGSVSAPELGNRMMRRVRMSRTVSVCSAEAVQVNRRFLLARLSRIYSTSPRLLFLAVYFDRDIFWGDRVGRVEFLEADGRPSIQLVKYFDHSTPVDHRFDLPFAAVTQLGVIGD